MVKKASPKKKSFWVRNGLLLMSMAGVLYLATWGVLMVRQNASPADTTPAGANVITVYKRPGCQCCDKWVQHLQKAGFSVKVEQRTDVDQIRSHLGVPANYVACHTAMMRGYVIEGHVPATDIQRLLIEHPAIAGLAVPGMPVGSPGMEQGTRRERYDVMTFDAHGQTSVYQSYAATP